MEMKASDLEKIINACGKNGVNRIKLGEIEIEFNGFVKVLETDYPEIVEGTEKIAVTDPNFEKQQELEKHLEDQDELMILNPSKWEENMMKE